MRIIYTLIFVIVCFALCQAQDRSGTSKSFVSDLSFSKGGTLLAAAEDQSICIYHYNTQSLYKKLQGGHRGDVLSVAISPDSSLVVSGGKDGKVILWSLTEGKVVQELYQHTGVVTNVKFSPDGKRIVSGASDDKMAVHDLDKKIQSTALSFHTDDVTAIAFLNNKMVISAGADGKVAFWNLEKNELQTSFKDRRSWIRSIAVEEEGRYLYTVGDNGRVHEWTISNLDMITKSETTHWGTSWVMGVDHSLAHYADAYSSMSGLVLIKTTLSFLYMQKLKAPATKILFQPQSGIVMKLAVATYGGGVVFIDAREMPTVDTLFGRIYFSVFSR